MSHELLGLVFLTIYFFFISEPSIKGMFYISGKFGVEVGLLLTIIVLGSPDIIRGNNQVVCTETCSYNSVPTNTGATNASDGKSLVRGRPPSSSKCKPR